MDFEVTDDLHVGLQAKKVGDRFAHRPQRRGRAGIHRGRSRPELGSSFPGFESARVPVQRDQPARRRVLRQHQLGHRRRHLGRASSRIGAPRTVVGVAPLRLLNLRADVRSVLALLIARGGGHPARRRGGTGHPASSASPPSIAASIAPAEGALRRDLAHARQRAGARRRRDHPARAARHPAAAGIRLRRGRRGAARLPD